jgi:hypothetical protein
VWPARCLQLFGGECLTVDPLQTSGGRSAGTSASSPSWQLLLWVLPHYTYKHPGSANHVSVLPLPERRIPLPIDRRASVFFHFAVPECCDRPAEHRRNLLDRPRPPNKPRRLLRPPVTPAAAPLGPHGKLLREEREGRDEDKGTAKSEKSWRILCGCPRRHANAYTQLAAPKSKYVEHILVATHAGEAGVAEIFRALTNRLRDSTWTIVFKSLIIVHLMIREGEPEVTLKYLAQNPTRKLAINSFTEGTSIHDRGSWRRCTLHQRATQASKRAPDCLLILC